MNLLVMANDPLRRAILSESLSMMGHTVHEAGNRSEALTLLEQSTIDLVVSGTETPAADPVQLHRTMRDQQRYSSLPFVQYGEVAASQGKELLKDGRVDFLLKRSDPLRRLLDVVRAQDEKRKLGPR
jgi:CheY-like chemotaxis protein